MKLEKKTMNICFIPIVKSHNKIQLYKKNQNNSYHCFTSHNKTKKLRKYFHHSMIMSIKRHVCKSKKSNIFKNNNMKFPQKV